MTADDVKGWEYDWLAVDGDGHVACFSTAGGSHAPAGLLEHPAEHEAAIDALLAASPTTTATQAPVLPSSLTNPWKALAERGLFGFDGDVFGGPYRRVATPDRPARLADLPAAAIVAASRMQLPALRFLTCGDLQGEDLGPGGQTWPGARVLHAGHPGGGSWRRR